MQEQIKAQSIAPSPQSEMDTMGAHAEQAAALLQAMSNAHRLMILCALAQGELNVGELNGRLDLSQSALSQHLALLRKQGLVATRRQSQTIYYAVTPGPALEIVQLLHDHFCPSPHHDASNDY